MLLMGGDLRNRPGPGPPAKRPVGPRHKPIAMRTIGDFQRSPGYMLWVNCSRCGRYRTLDISALAQRYGRGAIAGALIAALALLVFLALMPAG